MREKIFNFVENGLKSEHIIFKIDEFINYLDKEANLRVNKEEFIKDSFCTLINHVEWTSILNDKDIYYDYLLKSIDKVLLKDYNLKEKIKFLEDLGQNIYEHEFIFEERILKSLNIPQLTINFEKPLLLSYAQKDYNNDEKYVIKKNIFSKIDYGDLVLLNNNIKISLMKLDINSRKEVLNNLTNFAYKNKLEVEELPLMKYLDKYNLNGNPFYNLNFILEKDFLNGKSFVEEQKPRTGQEILLEQTENLLDFMLTNETGFTETNFVENKNKIELFFGAMDDKNKRVLLDNLIDKFENKIYNKQIADLVLTDFINKKIDQRIEILNDKKPIISKNENEIDI